MTAIYVTTTDLHDPDTAAAVEAVGALVDVRLHRLDVDALEIGAYEDAPPFVHTPEPLIRAWLVARAVIDATAPGDTVILEDRSGLGGVLALGESTKPATGRRHVWTVAHWGRTLRDGWVYHAIDEVDAGAVSQVDWEITQYRNSSRVFTLCDAASDVLAQFDVDARVITVPDSTVESSVEPVARRRVIWCPGPVARRNRSGRVLRALADIGDADVVVSSVDADDVVWEGTTWDTLNGVRMALGDRLQRSSIPPDNVSHVVIGDAFAAPDAETAALRSAGVAIVAAAGSVAAAMWPDAVTWSTEDELARVMTGGGLAFPVDVHAPSSGRDEARPTAQYRAVTVAVPTHGDAPFLDACLSSIFDQTVLPVEVIVVDDGSRSAELDTRLSAWQDRHPDVIRVMRQPNRGVCVARNLAIESATGDAFVLVDHDDVLAPRFIERTRDALEADGGLWAAAVWTRFFGEYEGVEAKPPFDRRVGRRENPIISTAALIPTWVRDTGIAFDPELAFVYCEDWHYWSQIVAAGGRMGLVPEVLINHRVHRASGGFRRTETGHRIGMQRAVAPLLG